MEYWDCWRDTDIGSGKTARKPAFLEMSSEPG
jgi:hypothetical protein